MAFLILSVIVLAPAYALHFPLGPLPANLLMVWVFLIWVVFSGWLWKKKLLLEFIFFLKNLDKKILTLVALFLISGLISLVWHGTDRAKLGQFTVIFLQPISIFFISRYLIIKFPQTRRLLLTTCYLLLAIFGLYAAVQYFSLLGLPVAYWGNSVEPKRATSFFGHPNFYALFSAPLLALLIPDMVSSLKAKSYNLKAWSWLFGTAGLFFSMSRAGWLGLFTAIVIYLVVAADNKIRKTFFAVAAAAILVVMATPNLRYRLILPFYGEKSAVSRLSLWHTGIKAIKESPIFGLGLTGFAQNWKTLNTDPGLAADSHNFPHNIFLNFWVETGILGLLSFLGLCVLAIYRGFKNRANIFAFGTALFLIALIIQGQIDNPYFKNDLALVFWVILSVF